MKIVRELRGWCHLFTTKSGDSLRVFPNQTKEINASEVSEDMERAVKMKLISITDKVENKSSAVSKHSKNAADGAIATNETEVCE